MLGRVRLINYLYSLAASGFFMIFWLVRSGLSVL
jgi:hypothetical protein